MARNLREKLFAILNDSYDLRQESLVTKLENLLKEELELKQEERLLTYQDIVYIQSVAVKEFVDLNPSEQSIGKLAYDQDMMKHLCLINATILFLRGKGLLSSTFKYKK